MDRRLDALLQPGNSEYAVYFIKESEAAYARFRVPVEKVGDPYTMYSSRYKTHDIILHDDYVEVKDKKSVEREYDLRFKDRKEAVKVFEEYSYKNVAARNKDMQLSMFD